MCMILEYTPASTEVGWIVPCKKLVLDRSWPGIVRLLTGVLHRPIPPNGWLLRASTSWKYLYDGRRLAGEGVHAYSLPAPAKNSVCCGYDEKLLDALAIGVLGWGYQSGYYYGSFKNLCSLAMLVRMPDGSNLDVWNKTKAILKKPMSKRASALLDVIPSSFSMVIDEYEQIDW